MKRLILILLLSAPLFAFEKTPQTTPTQVNVKSQMLVYINGDLKDSLTWISQKSTALSTVSFDTSFIFNVYVLPETVFVPIEPDTSDTTVTVPVDTSGLPELNIGEAFTVAFPYEQEFPVMFSYRFGTKDTSVTYGKRWATYQVDQDSVKYVFKYGILLDLAGEATLYEQSDGIVLRKTIQTAWLQIIADDLGLLPPSEPSLPYFFKAVRWDTLTTDN